MGVYRPQNWKNENLTLVTIKSSLLSHFILLLDLNPFGSLIAWAVHLDGEFAFRGSEASNS